jgi:hypothetical protein
MPGLILGHWHIADVNQNTAEPHAAIIAPVSMNDLMIAPNYSGVGDYMLIQLSHDTSGFDTPAAYREFCRLIVMRNKKT